MPWASAATSRTRCCPKCRRCAPWAWVSWTWRCGTACSPPAGTPRALLERLNAELKLILALPDVKAAFETQGMSPAHSSTDEFRRLIASDAERWAQVVKAQNILAD